MSWNFGDILDGIARVMPPTAPALIYGDRLISWADFDRRSNRLAARLIALGAKPGDKVALYLRNPPAYMETLAACFKARLVHVNVNFRYGEDELQYIFDNSDARYIVFAQEFGAIVTRLRDRLGGVAGYVQVDDGSPPVDFAEPYESIVTQGDGLPLEIERSPDDLLLLYTGGTTGMPKGVMWRHEDLWDALGRGANLFNANARPETLEDHVERVRSAGPGARQIPACPLMHGTGLFSAIGVFMSGGCIVTLTSPGFDADELWRAVEAHGVNALAIVGDAFGKPMLAALDAAPGKYDLSSLILIVSSGVMWSREVKKGLLAHHDGLVLVDSFGSSEAVGFGNSIMTAKGEAQTARFTIGDRVKVFDEQGREVVPGSGQPGFVARSGPIPLGYYRDEEKTARTFKTIDGVRYSIPGDWCTVEEDGTLNLLGRGSVCINTGGEKVYPEEVEEVLKTHPSVEDALVIGLPDERWGQAVTGVVQLGVGAVLDEDALCAHVRARLAGFKTPKRVIATKNLGRADNGKADYRAVTEYAKRQLGID